jgi:hypothetical protein
VRTEEQIREYNREYLRRRRTELKAQGLCVYCGLRPAVEGRVLCASCRDRARANTVARRTYLLGRGLCLDCGREKAVPGKRRCAACQQRATGKNCGKRHPEEIG